MKKCVLLSLSLVLVLALSFLVFGCGGEETTTTAAPSTDTTAAPTTTSAAPSTDTTAAPSTDTTAAAIEPIELTMVSFIPDLPPGGNWARDFTSKIEEYSGGKMTVKLSGPEAIPAPDQVAAVQKGTVDIASVLSPFADTLVPGASCAGRAEYNPMQLRAKADQEGYFKYLKDTFAKSGILYLGASVSSEPQVQTVFYLGKEITGIDELKGMKIAAVGGSNKAFIEALGATCVPIDFTDYFTSMERGTVDAYNVGIPGILDFGLTPVTKAMLNEPFSSCGGLMLMNMDKWNSLSPAQQDVINKAIVQTEIDGAAMFTKTVEEVIAQITKDGVKEIKLSPEDSKAFFLAYRDSMWAEDLKRWPDIAPKIKEWLVDPAFPRAN
jgi:TRAP-type transport system periplasmic protein